MENQIGTIWYHIVKYFLSVHMSSSKKGTTVLMLETKSFLKAEVRCSRQEKLKRYLKFEKRWKFFHMFRILLTENIFEKLQRKLFPFPRVDHLGLCKFYFVTLLQVSAEDWTNLEECWTIDIIQSIVYLQCFLEDGGSPLPGGGAPKKLVGEGVELFPHVRNCLLFCLCLGAEELT